VSSPVVFVADAGEEAGLGHISRSSALAVALQCRGIATRCFAYGAHQEFTRDGVTWLPLHNPDLLDSSINVLVIDSYRLRHEDLPAVVSPSRRVVMHDHGGPPEDAALVVTTTQAGGPARGMVLTGFTYAVLRPGFWGLPARVLDGSVQRVLVSTGSGHFHAFGVELAQALTMALPTTAVTLVRGPYERSKVRPDVETIDAPESLLEPLLAADIAVTAGGQTMLEAAATGTPCIALPLVDNQRPQVELLGDLGAVRVVDPPCATETAATALALAHEPEARQTLSRTGRRTVDGYGALRVAFEIARLARAD
jgi:spore coat polysaccharide biosynthesis predicted glycosyltransferase SpsG